MRVMRRSAVSIPKSAERAEQPLAQLIATVDYTLAATTTLERKFSDVYRLLFERLCAFARRFLDPDPAEDVVNEAMSSIWDRWSEGKIDPHSARFFFRAVRNRIAVTRMREHRELVRMGTYLYLLKTWYQPLRRPDAEIERAELATVIDDTVVAMPMRCRTVWLLVNENNMTYDEVAAELKITQTTARRHMSRAQRLLREALFDAGYVESPKLLPAKVSRGRMP
jgi:RNA polymerase sigma-70 factor (ECF subfamily)